MTSPDGLAGRFESDRAHLRAVAQRILGSPDEAEDAVQETWVRLSRSDTSDVANLTGWLTTVVSRVCLDMLRSRVARREDPAELPAELPVAEDHAAGPEQQAVLADAIGPALLLVLDTLTPNERLAFVLHDMFAVPFPEIATVLDCSPAAARQLASRARRRVQGGPAASDGGDLARRRTVVEAFLAASREGDFTALLALLHPDAEVRGDNPAQGADAVARMFSGRAKGAQPALIDGEPGAVWLVHREPRVAFRFTVTDGVVTAIDLLGGPALADLDIEVD